MQAALQTGVIGYLQAAAVAAGVRDLPDPLAVAVADRVLRAAPDQTVAETKRAVARAVATVDPASAADRHQQATANRTIEQLPQPDGMESTWFTMPAPVSRDLWATLTADAKAAQADRRLAGLPFVGLDALRVDALVHAVLGTGGADPHHPTMTTVTTGRSDAGPDAAGDTDQTAARATRSPAGPRLPRCRCGGAQTAAVVIDLPTLLGLADRPGRSPATARSPQQRPGPWAPTGTGSAGWSTPAPAPCSTSAPTGTARATRCAGSSPPGTAGAGSPAAPRRPTSATATT